MKQTLKKVKKIKTTAAIFAAATIALFAASCKKEYLPEDASQHITGVKRTINATAALPQGGDKAYLDYTDGHKVKWELTDSLNINGTNLALTNLNADPTKAYFEGSAYAIPSGSQDIYWVVYPTTLSGAASGSSIPSDFTATTLKVNFPATQTYDASDNTLRGNTFMAAYTTAPSGENNIEFQMRNLCAIMELDMTPYCNNNTRVDSIVFTSSNAMLAGTFTVSNNATNPTIAPATGSTNKLVVTIQNGSNNYIDITGGKKVRVILPPLAGKNLNMKIYGTDGNYMERNAASITLARNNYYTSAITYDNLSNVNPAGLDSNVVGFSVAPGKRVLFSPGNLQYQASGSYLDGSNNLVGGTWRFATNQWNFVGDATEGNVYGVGGDPTVKCDNAQISSTYQGWIDLFGWGTSGWNSGATAYLPYDITTNPRLYYPGGLESTNLHDALYAQADWGVYNAIYNPKTGSTDPAGTWRTLTNAQWVYMINTRRVNVNCSPQPMYGHANVHGVNGLVILPDNWNPASCPGFRYGSSAWLNIFDETTTTKWSEMEAVGCVFLPAAGRRSGGTTVNSAGSQGNYWATTRHNALNSYGLDFLSGRVTPDNMRYSYLGNSVRLVKEVN